MNRRRFLFLSGAAGMASTLGSGANIVLSAADAAVSAKAMPPAGGNAFYAGNRAPLAASPFSKLPIGAIEPRGWLRQQLLLMADGMTGHLAEFSQFLASSSGWLTGKPQDPGWEEMPYWLRGYGDLGYVLKDDQIIHEAKRWLDAALTSQQANGYFGSPLNKTNNDLWPNMLMLNALQSRYEFAGDQRVLPFMTRYFRYELRDAPGEVAAGQLAKNSRRRQSRQCPLAVQPHRRSVAARSGKKAI